MDLRRVSVIGTSCSGKSTFARDLARLLGSPHFELDAMYWKPNWSAAPDEEFRACVDDVTKGDRWIVDGNYRVANEIVWSRATAIVWLDYAFLLVFYRALRRTIRRVARKELLFAGNRETFRVAFLSRQSILLWVITTHWRRKKQYRALMADVRDSQRETVRFRNPWEAKRFLSSLRSAPPGPA
jgi:adenylate kinase family enzyme